jgi:hypothetical protein
MPETAPETREFTGPAVIVDPYSSGALYPAAFAARGVPVVAVVSAPRPLPAYASSYRPDELPEIIIFDGDLESLAARLRVRAPRCVITGCESGVELCERLAPLVVPSRSNVAELAPARRDKNAMAAAVAAAGLTTIPQICTADPDEVEDWLAHAGLVGHDLVIKPPKSASTDGVVKLPGGAGWRETFGKQLGRVNQFEEIDDVLLVQKFIAGTEYVVDTFSHDGRHTLVDVCRYHKVDNGPHMAVYDTMRWVGPDDPVVPKLMDYTRGVLDAVGLRFGSAHVEVMSTPDGPVLIELGARPHGGGHPRFNLVATGDSQIERTVRHLTGEAVRSDYELRQHQMCVFHIARASGVVRDTAVLDEIGTLTSHHLSIRGLRDGDLVTATKDLVDSLNFGFVILSHPDPGQIERDYATIRELEARLVIEQPDTVDA